MSNSVQPHRQQPTRLLHPWDSPGKNTGVDCHFLFQCMKVKTESEVAQSCPTLSNPMDCSLPGSSVHGIFQARELEWVAIAFSKMCSRAKERGLRGHNTHSWSHLFPPKRDGSHKHPSFQNHNTMLTLTHWQKQSNLFPIPRPPLVPDSDALFLREETKPTACLRFEGSSLRKTNLHFHCSPSPGMMK